jgi:transposase-like protein
MTTGIHLDYQELRKTSPEAARQAILAILTSARDNIAETARVLSVTRATVYKALRKKKAGSLADSSRAPHTIANKTREDIEKQVIEIKTKTNYGPGRILDELFETKGITLSKHTIRNIIRRNRDTIKTKRHKPKKASPRQFVDWYSAKAFEIVQIDLKHIVDQKALTEEQISHIYAHDLPLYQWGALDVTSRFKLVGYSTEKTWTNGLCWFLWVTSWLRSHGVSCQIIYTVDHGVEFGGDCWWKIADLKKLLSGFGCKLIQNHKKSPQENAHLERSHRTDDDEFYIPRILHIKTRETFFTEALNYLYYYNNVRKHSSLNQKTPYAYLRTQLSELDDTIKIVPPIFLDKVAVELGAWSGYHVLANYQMKKKLPEKSPGFKTLILKPG